MTDVLTDPGIRFISSGSTLLNLALGGGWAIPRIFNIVGDKSSGKTLLAIESFANFSRTFPDGRMRYAEAESAFDEVYASILGFPKNVTKPDDGMLTTVQEFQEDLKKFVAEGVETKTPGLYILDSLDALSDDAEIKEFFREKKPDEEARGSYGMSKPKEMSKLFRVLTQEIEKSNTSVGIISQIRDNISTFPMRGESKTRSGGHALNFYSSQITWLREIDKIKRTFLGEERTIGIEVEAVIKKNKVGFPFRTARFPIVFSYGVDDEQSMLDWLKLRGQITVESHKIYKKRLEVAREEKDYTDVKAIQSELKLDVYRVWAKMEEEMAPPIRKYAEELK